MKDKTKTFRFSAVLAIIVFMAAMTACEPGWELNGTWVYNWGNVYSSAYMFASGHYEYKEKNSSGLSGGESANYVVKHSGNYSVAGGRITFTPTEAMYPEDMARKTATYSISGRTLFLTFDGMASPEIYNKQQ
jgi:hypothetical protein